MTRNVILSALATVALAVTGPALAKPGKGGGHGPNVAAKAKAKAKAGGRTEVKAHSQRRQKSQGPAHASPRALERANANSVLAGNTVVVGPLAGLSVGTPIRIGNDVLGTVERIVPGGERRVSNVLVRTTDGRMVPLDPHSLTSDGSSWSATSRRRGGSGR